MKHFLDPKTNRPTRRLHTGPPHANHTGRASLHNRALRLRPQTIRRAHWRRCRLWTHNQVSQASGFTTPLIDVVRAIVIVPSSACLPLSFFFLSSLFFSLGLSLEPFIIFSDRVRPQLTAVAASSLCEGSMPAHGRFAPSEKATMDVSETFSGPQSQRSTARGEHRRDRPRRRRRNVADGLEGARGSRRGASQRRAGASSRKRRVSVRLHTVRRPSACF